MPRLRAGGGCCPAAGQTGIPQGLRLLAGSVAVPGAIRGRRLVTGTRITEIIATEITSQASPPR